MELLREVAKYIQSLKISHRHLYLFQFNVGTEACKVVGLNAHVRDFPRNRMRSLSASAALDPNPISQPRLPSEREITQIILRHERLTPKEG